MTVSTLRLPYDDADATGSMRRDAEVAGRRLGVDREAMLDRGATRGACRPPGSDLPGARERPLGGPR